MITLQQRKSYWVNIYRQKPSAISAWLSNITSCFLSYCVFEFLRVETYFGTPHLNAKACWCVMYFQSEINTEKEEERNALSLHHACYTTPSLNVTSFLSFDSDWFPHKFNFNRGCYFKQTSSASSQTAMGQLLNLRTCVAWTSHWSTVLQPRERTLVAGLALQSFSRFIE